MEKKKENRKEIEKNVKNICCYVRGEKKNEWNAKTNSKIVNWNNFEIFVRLKVFERSRRICCLL